MEVYQKDVDNSHFYYSDDFLQTVIEVLVITLYIHSAKYSTIDTFYVWIEGSDWLFLIGNVKKSCLSITKVCSIQNRAFTRINAAVAIALRAKKEWANLEDQPLEPN